MSLDCTFRIATHILAGRSHSVARRESLSPARAVEKGRTRRHNAHSAHAARYRVKYFAVTDPRSLTHTTVLRAYMACDTAEGSQVQHG